jgi:hypothetical protein
LVAVGACCRPAAEPPSAQIIAAAACRIAQIARAVSIVVFTATGATARLVARYRPPVPVYAFTSNPAAARQLAVIFGLRAVVTTQHASTDQMMELMNRTLVEQRMISPGDVVVVAGVDIFRAPPTWSSCTGSEGRWATCCRVRARPSLPLSPALRAKAVEFHDARAADWRGGNRCV